MYVVLDGQNEIYKADRIIDIAKFLKICNATISNCITYGKTIKLGKFAGCNIIKKTVIKNLYTIVDDDKFETVLQLFDTIEELAKHENIKPSTIKVMLWKYHKGINKTCKYRVIPLDKSIIE